MKHQKGFTIIEVLIVLAIAAVIMLAAFLVVSQARLTMRNEARMREAATFVQQIRECLSRNNDSAVSCDSPTEVPVAQSAVGVYDRAYFCGSEGPVVQTGCGAMVDGFPDFNYMYTNGYDYSSSTTWTFLEVRYGHKCSVSSNRSQPATKTSIVVMVPYERLDGSSYSKCLEY